MPISIARAVVVWALTSQAVLAIAGAFVPMPEFAFASRDLVTLGILFFLIFTRGMPTPIQAILVSALPLFVQLLVMSSISEVGLVGTLAAIRQMITPLAIVCLAISLTHSAKDAPAALVRLVVVAVTWVAVLGLLERFLHLWGTLGILRPFFESKSIPVFPSGYPYIFIEPLGISEFSSHSGLLRASSTLLDPINFGHTMVAGVVAYLLAQQMAEPRRRIHFGPAYWVMLAALAASISKGAIGQMIAILILCPAAFPIRLLGPVLALGGSIVGITYILDHPGFILHMEGLWTAIETATELGHGLGTTGNYALMLGNQTVGISDTFLGSIVGQIGVLGYTSWLLPFACIALFAKSRLLRAALVTQIGASVVSENAFNIGSVFILLFVVGVDIASHYRLPGGGTALRRNNRSVGVLDGEEVSQATLGR